MMLQQNLLLFDHVQSPGHRQQYIYEASGTSTDYRDKEEVYFFLFVCFFRSLQTSSNLSQVVYTFWTPVSRVFSFLLLIPPSIYVKIASILL